jgi:hypothetical protein
MSLDIHKRSIPLLKRKIRWSTSSCRSEFCYEIVTLKVMTTGIRLGMVAKLREKPLELLNTTKADFIRF